MSEIYVHLGFSKTGSSYLQKWVFPYFKDVVFFDKNSMAYMPYMEKFYDVSKNGKAVLFSAEWLSGSLPKAYNRQESYLDSQKRLIDSYTEMLSDSTGILFVREHRNYILSLYKHYLKYGGHLKFSQFFGSNESNALIKLNDVLFAQYLNYYNGRVGKFPKVFSQKEMMDSPDTTIDKLSSCLGHRSFIGELKRSRENVGLGARQASVTRLRNYIKMLCDRTRVTRGIFRILSGIGIIPSVRFISSLPIGSSELTFPEDIYNNYAVEFEEDWAFVQKLIADQAIDSVQEGIKH